MAGNLLNKKKIGSNKHDRGDEMNFLSFFHSSPDLLFVFDPDGFINFF